MVRGWIKSAATMPRQWRASFCKCRIITCLFCRNKMPNGSSVPVLRQGPPRQMLGEAIDFVKSLPQDAIHRADAFEALARQIESHTGCAWSAARGTGTDGSIIFLGRQGE